MGGATRETALPTGRGTGKTKAMVERLPKSGAVVVVHTSALRDHVRRMISDIHDYDVLCKTEIVVCARRGDEKKLCGFRVPVFVDHAFAGSVKPDVRDAVMEMAHGCNLAIGDIEP